MKKYISLIVCAVITLAALIIPIGSGARYDGKGSGKNQSVKNLDELSNALQGSSATYTLTYSEGVNVSRHSLNIYRENYQDENEISTVVVYKDDILQQRVTDLHRNDANNSGRLYNQSDYLNLVDYNMDTGIVKIKYQTDFYGRYTDDNGDPINEDRWIGEGFVSGSDLGLKMKEAKEDIQIFSDSGKSTPVSVIEQGQVFVLEEEGTVRYSQGNGFVKGYISSSNYTDVYISVFFDENQEKEVIKGEPINTLSGVNYHDENTCKTARVGVIYHGRVYRWYKSDSVVYKAYEGDIGTTINYSIIAVKEGEDWVTRYCLRDSIAFRVEAVSYEKAFTNNYDKGTIKVYKTADAVYAQVESEMTLAHNKTNIRTTINAEFIIKGNKNLIKINSFFYADDSGSENTAAMEFLTGSPDGTTFGESKIKLNQWMDAKNAKIYFNSTTNPNRSTENPLNFFLDKYFNDDGSLKQTQFLASLIDANLLELNGKEAFVKSSITTEQLCEGLYQQIIGADYNEFIPTSAVENSIKTAFIDVNFSNKKMTVIKSRFEYSLPTVSIFDTTSNCTSKFESASDRTVTIENVGNTVIPKVVMEEVKGLLG